MRWGQIKKNTDIGIQSFSKNNLRARISSVADYLSEDDSRRTFILSVLSRASKGSDLTQRQLSYFESIEEIYLTRKRSEQAPPAYDRNIWRDRIAVDKSNLNMGNW